MIAISGRTVAEWIVFVQERIAAHTRPTEDPNHGATDFAAWISDLRAELQSRWPEGWETWTAAHPDAFDENMRMARELGTILCAWFSAVQRAKTRDPNRPVNLRRAAYQRRHAWLEGFIGVLIDDSFDPDMFPGQKWDLPYAPDAHDGKFV